MKFAKFTALATCLLSTSIMAETLTIFKDVNVFTGNSPKLLESYDVVVEGQHIRSIGKDLIVEDEMVVIEGEGRTLTPGLIDVHWHSMLSDASLRETMTQDFAYLALVAADAGEKTLQRGFTTVRDMGGNSFSVKKLTDANKIHGPRIFPSGAMISQTSGHGDFRDTRTFGTDYLAESGHVSIADGEPQVLVRTRENLMRGATQIKVLAGGGVSSLYDPLEVTQYSEKELKAVVEAAKDWNTYVAVHAFTDRAVQRALNAGVMSIEHGHLISEDTAKLMAKKGAWLSMQPFTNDEDAMTFDNPVSQAKNMMVLKGTDNVYKLAKKYKLNVAFGTDALFDGAQAAKQNKLAAKLSNWFTPYEVMKMITYDNAQLLQLSGPLNTYQGSLGEVSEGALADLVLIDGNPLEDIQLIANPEDNFSVIMKDGVIYKNKL